jgi:DNA-binding transcriptional LysR family regulator
MPKSHQSTPRVDLDGLDAFLAVVARGGFTAAARAAGVAPSVISRRVAALEARMGVALLARSTRRVGLTDAGRELAARAAGPLQALLDAADEVRAAESALSGLVRVSMPGALGRRRVAPLLFAFAAQHPGVSLDLRVSDAAVDLVAEGVDLAVRVGAPREPGFTVRTLGRSPQVFAATPAYLAGRPPLRSLADLGGHRLLLRREGGRVLGPALPSALVCDDVETVARAAAAGLGLAMVPAWLAEDFPALMVLDAPSPVPPAVVVAVLPGGRRPPRRVRAVLDALVAGWEAAPGGAHPAGAEEVGVSGPEMSESGE